MREAAGVGLLDGFPVAFGGDRRGGFALLCDLEAAAGQRVQQRWFAVGGGVAVQAGGVSRDQPVAVELYEAVKDGAGGAAGERGARDQGRGREPGAVKQREDGVVLVIEPWQPLDAVHLVGGSDLVDPVQEHQFAKRVGDRPVGLGRGGLPYPAADEPRAGLSARSVSLARGGS